MGGAQGALTPFGDLGSEPCLLLADAHAEHGHDSARAGEGKQGLAVKPSSEEDDRARMARPDRAA